MTLMFSLFKAVSLIAVLANVTSVLSQGSPPSSFPHVYPGQPSGDLSPAWQKYFEVTEKLPNVTFETGRSFAGNIPVQRSGHPNDTLFFWGFEKENGSLTASAGSSNEPWGIWLNGGPGSSSIFGLLFENGPIRLKSDYGATANNYSWSKLADYIWIDQPVGTGFSTADVDGYVADEDQMGTDFMGFLANLVKVFPSLATRPLHITGESYAGVYIPYILKAYFGMAKPPVNIAKIAIGDGSITSEQVFELLPALSIIETYPQVIGYDIEVYKYFKEQSHLCGYDVNLTYPQTEPLTTVPLVLPSGRDFPWTFNQNRLGTQSLVKEVSRRYSLRNRDVTTTDFAKRTEAHQAWKTRRDLSDRANGTLDPWYGCVLLDEFIDYAINFTYPWNIGNTDPNIFSFDYYDVPDALSPEVTADGTVFLNDPRTRAAIHAPTSKDWAMFFSFPFGAQGGNDPSPEPMVFFNDLASNASAHNIPFVLYSGNDDALIAHRSTEVAIQNTTFGGIQGFSRKPSTAWHDDAGNFAGIVHQERNWTYVLFQGTGHTVPASKPAAAFTFLREFVLGSNTTGLVTTSSSGLVSVIGGEDSVLAEDIMPGSDEIYYGSAATQGTYVFPSATIAAWKAFIQTETAVPSSVSVNVNNSDANAGQRAVPWVTSTLLLAVAGGVLALV